MTAVAASAAASVPTTDWRVETIHDEAGLRALAAEWDGLFARMARPSPFLAYTWVETWQRHFGRESRLWVLALRDSGGALIGLAPLHVVSRRIAGALPLRSVEFLGYRGSSVCADHLDFLAPAEQREAVARALIAELLRRAAEWDALVLAGLAADSPIPELWRELSPGGTAVRPEDICYHRDLPADISTLWTEIKRHHPKLASNVKYYRKRLQQQKSVEFIAPVPADQVQATLQALVQLHTQAHARKGQSGNFFRPDYLGFHSDLLGSLAADPRLYLARLDCDGAPTAILYGFLCGGVLYYYQSGFDPALGSFGVGTLLLASVFEDAIARLGAREFDFLRGAEEYKSRWTADARWTREFRAWQRTLAGRLSALEYRARRRAAAFRDRRKAAAAHA